MQLEPALVIDAVNVFHRAITELQKNKFQSPGYAYRNNEYSYTTETYTSKRCTDNSNVYKQNGSALMAILKKKEVCGRAISTQKSFPYSTDLCNRLLAIFTLIRDTTVDF